MLLRAHLHFSFTGHLANMIGSLREETVVTTKNGVVLHGKEWRPQKMVVFMQKITHVFMVATFYRTKPHRFFMAAAVFFQQCYHSCSQPAGRGRRVRRSWTDALEAERRVKRSSRLSVLRVAGVCLSCIYIEMEDHLDSFGWLPCGPKNAPLVTVGTPFSTRLV